MAESKPFYKDGNFWVLQFLIWMQILIAYLICQDIKSGAYICVAIGLAWFIYVNDMRRIAYRRWSRSK